jgi:hypothetical protein
MIRDCQEQLDRLYAEIGGDTTPSLPPDDAAQVNSDARIIEIATQAANREKFKRLYAGDGSVLDSEDKSGSAVDQAIVNILAHYTRNHEQLERLWKASPHAQSRQLKMKRSKYVNSTIAKALDRAIPTVDISALTAQCKAMATATPAPPAVHGSEGKSRGQKIIFADMADELLHPTEPRYLIKDVIEENTTGGLFGESTAGKSFIAVSKACCCATGFPWAGHEVLRPGPVIYYAGEGRQGIPRRVAAWQECHGVTIPKGRFFLPKGRVEFDAEGARLVADAVEGLAQQHGPPVLLLIDTLARAMPAGSDENSAKDMMEFLNAVDSIRDRFGCVALIVHHTGHGEETRTRARGSSAFKAAMDFEILADKRKGLLSWTKMKDAEIPPPVPYKLESVGRSAVVAFGDPASPQGDNLGKTDAFALTTLQDACSRMGRTWATVEEWRVDFYRRHHADSVSTKRKAFNRARADLVEKGAVHLDSDMYAIAGQAGQSRDTGQMSRPL